MDDDNSWERHRWCFLDDQVCSNLFHLLAKPLRPLEIWSCDSCHTVCWLFPTAWQLHNCDKSSKLVVACLVVASHRWNQTPLLQFDLNIKSDDATYSLIIKLKGLLGTSWSFFMKSRADTKTGLKMAWKIRLGQMIREYVYDKDSCSRPGIIWPSLQNQKRAPRLCFQLSQLWTNMGREWSIDWKLSAVKYTNGGNFLLHCIIIYVTNWAIPLNRKYFQTAYNQCSVFLTSWE